MFDSFGYLYLAFSIVFLIAAIAFFIILGRKGPKGITLFVAAAIFITAKFIPTGNVREMLLLSGLLSFSSIVGGVIGIIQLIWHREELSSETDFVPVEIIADGNQNSKIANTRLQDVIFGQKLLIWGLLGYVVFGILAMFGPFLSDEFGFRLSETLEILTWLPWVLLALSFSLLACFGIHRIGRVLYTKSNTRAYILLSLIPIPLIPLFIFVMVNQNAYSYLSDHGCKPGFLGTKQIR